MTNNALRAKYLHNLPSVDQVGTLIDPNSAVMLIELPGTLDEQGNIVTGPDAFNMYAAVQVSIATIADYIDTKEVSRDIPAKDITTLTGSDSFLGFTVTDRERFSVQLGDITEYIRQALSDLNSPTIPESDIVNGTDIFVIQRDTTNGDVVVKEQYKIPIAGVGEYIRHKLVDNTPSGDSADLSKLSQLFILVDPEYDTEYRSLFPKDISWLVQTPGYGNERDYSLGDIVSIDGTYFICLDTFNQQDTFNLIEAGCTKADPQLSWVYDDIHPEATVFRSYFIPLYTYEQGLLGSVASTFDLEYFYPKYFVKSDGQLITDKINDEMLDHIMSVSPERLIGDAPDVTAYTESNGVSNMQFTLLRKISE